MAVPRCRNCGQLTSGPFCASCGLRAGTSEGLPADDEGPVLAGSVHRGSTARRLAVLAVLALGSVALVVGVLRSSQPAELADPAPTSIADSGASTTSPVSSESTTTTALGRPVTSAPSPTVAPAGLGPSADWYVLVAADGDLLRIDLASGSVAVIAEDLAPLLHTGGRILLRRPSDPGALLVAEAASLATADVAGAEVLPLAQLTYDARLLVGSDPERIWVVSPSRDGPPSIHELDITTGETVRTIPYHPLHDQVWWGGGRTPEFLSPMSGGVYRLDADGAYVYQRPGFVDADGRGLILITECGAVLECSRTWYDAQDLSERSDLFAPAASAWSPFVLGEGSVVGGPGVLIHIHTGRTRSVTNTETSRLFDPGTIDMSPDGRFLFSVYGRHSYARDLETDQTWRLDDLDLDRSGPVFLPRQGK